MTKRELAEHLHREHPELVYPDLRGLMKWRKDELEREHDELHEMANVR